MNIQEIISAKKQIGIEIMPYRNTAAKMPFSIDVLTYFSIDALTYCRTVVLSY
jgi:hypothetical protein